MTVTELRKMQRAAGFLRIACEFHHADSEEGLHPQVLNLEAV